MKKSELWGYFLGILGLVVMWDSLVHLATGNDPLLGELNNHSPKWVAGDILIGVVLFADGCIAIGRRRNKDDKNQ
jgi:hypothetical protein